MKKLTIKIATVLATVALALTFSAVVPESIRDVALAQAGADADFDGFSDRIEEYAGSSPTSSPSTPEHAIFPLSCADSNDNDADGLTDSDDPGCSVQFEADELIVSFQPGTPQAFIDTIIPILGTEVVEYLEFVDIYLLSITSGDDLAFVLDSFLAHSEVQAAQPNTVGELLTHLTEPNDTNYRTQQWSLSNHGDQRPASVIDADIDAPQAWEHLVDCRAQNAAGVSQVVVAVLDSGVDAAHPDLAPVLVGNFAVPGLGGVGDQVGHGTFVAGIIGARGNNGGIGGGTTGVCWNSSIYSVKVTNTVALNVANLIAGVNRVLAVAGAPGGPNIRIINMSIGFPTPQPLLRVALLPTIPAGMLVVTGAGNDGLNPITMGNRVVFRNDPCSASLLIPAFPLAIPNVICVASSTETDTICASSGRGAAPGASVVHLAAPGSNIVGLIATGNPLATHFPTVPITLLPGAPPGGGPWAGTLQVCATSLAAPYVSGAAAHCWALRIKSGLPANATAIKGDLLAGVDPRPGIAGQTFGIPNVVSGRNNDGRLRMCMGDDFGDAPDPLGAAAGKYPTLLANNGGRHEDIGEEWFGDGPPFRASRDNGDGQARLHTLEVSPEDDANVVEPRDADGPMNLINNDSHDDGVTIFGPFPLFGVAVFNVCTENNQVVDAEGGRYTGGPSPGAPPHLVNDKAIFVNGFFDWNQDGDWDDVVGGVSEYAFSRRIVVPPPVAGATGAAVCHPPNIQIFQAPLLLPEGDIWSRFRLDYGEDVQHGAAGNAPESHVGHAAPPPARYDASPTLNRSEGLAQFGEVEDYVIEVDFFPDSEAEAMMTTPLSPDPETVLLTGPTTVVVQIGEVTDLDNDGLDEVKTEIVELELTGTSPSVGPIKFTVRDSAKHPFQRSTGQIEETFNAHPGTLDIEPFTPSEDCPGGCSADSFFDVFFEIELTDPPPSIPSALTLLHNEEPKRMETTITHKPPAEGETYESPIVLTLNDEDDNLTSITIEGTTHTPNPLTPVGGIVVGTSVSGPPLETPGSSGSNAGVVAGMVVGATAAAFALGGAAWYGRRRWLR